MYKSTRNYVTLVLTIIILALLGGSFAAPTAHAASSSPKITLLPPAGPVQTPITVAGTDFKPGASVYLYWYGYVAKTQSLGYYPIKTGIIAGSDGKFTATIIAPFDYGYNVLHNVNATQNDNGAGITNATFMIIPTMTLSPQPANYTEGQEAVLHMYGVPLEGVPGPHDPTEIPVMKFTYDNQYWGWIWSHLETVPVATGSPTGDVGGNATLRFKAVGATGKHTIRMYEGDLHTIGPWLGCEIGGEVEFHIVEGTKASTGNSTNIGLAVSSFTNLTRNYSLVALALSAISIIILLPVAARVFRKAEKL